MRNGYLSKGLGIVKARKDNKRPSSEEGVELYQLERPAKLLLVENYTPQAPYNAPFDARALENPVYVVRVVS
ncbi:MAG: hypothetical protein JWL80_519 [Parcubacteria group bacterium]|nr:hypothetical protein [Parcubacteria group bacterium]